MDSKRSPERRDHEDRFYSAIESQDAGIVSEESALIEDSSDTTTPLDGALASAAEPSGGARSRSPEALDENDVMREEMAKFWGNVREIEEKKKPLREGFFTESETPRHFLQYKDVSEHHRLDEFPHTRVMDLSHAHHHHKHKGKGHKRGIDHVHHHHRKKRRGSGHKQDQQSQEEEKSASVIIEEERTDGAVHPPLGTPATPAMGPAPRPAADTPGDVAASAAPDSVFSPAPGSEPESFIKSDSSFLSDSFSRQEEDSAGKLNTQAERDYDGSVTTPGFSTPQSSPDWRTSPPSQRPSTPPKSYQDLGELAPSPSPGSELSGERSELVHVIPDVKVITGTPVMKKSALVSPDQSPMTSRASSKRVAFFIGESPERVSLRSQSSDTRRESVPQLTDDLKGSLSYAWSGIHLDSAQRVTFHLGSDSGYDIPNAESEPSEMRVGQRKTGHEHIPTERDLEKRRARGSEVKLHDNRGQRTLDTIENGMNQADLDDLSSHRFEDAKAMRRRMIAHNAGTGPRDADYEPSQKLERLPRAIDRTPHELFVEMDELVLGSNDMYEWKQKARWIKFEENVEEGAERWGKPHVASLSFHSMLELRKCLEEGALLLDLDENDLQSIVNRVVDEMIDNGQLDAAHRGKIIAALLLRHTFTGENGGFLKRNSHAYIGLVDLEDGHPPEAQNYMITGKKYRFSEPFMGSSSKGNKHEAKTTFVNGTSEQGYVNQGLTLDGEIKVRHKSSHVEPTLVDLELMKKIPKGAQTTSVLVGQVDYLKKPTMAFVRLSHGRYLGNFTQVPLPVRFIFILMGPPNAALDYRDVGRAISTLMSNKKFNEIAFAAHERNDLLEGLNDFLDDSLVLPPGELDKKTLLPVLSMAKEKAQLRKRKRKEREQAARTKEAEAVEAEQPPDPLARTGRPFGGMIKDMKGRFPQYWSDIKDGLNLQCLSVFFFIYFAALSPAITFGGLLSDKTDKWIGVSEMLAGVAFMGVIFHIFAAQPLLIVGFTGPLLVFEEGLYQLSGTVGLEYISFRVWVGLWVAVIMSLVICFEGSFLVRYFTRFTEEIFAALISLIFIIEVFIKLASIFDRHPLKESYDESGEKSSAENNAADNGFGMAATLSPNDNMTGTWLDSTASFTDLMSNDSWYNMSTLSMGVTPGAKASAESEEAVRDQPNTALLSLILTMSTFFIAYFLKHFRNSKFLGRTARRALGDFGVPIAIIVMLTVDILIKEAYTEKLDVPNGLVPTDKEKRGWFINPMGMDEKLPIWAYFAAIIPALLAVILIFMESMITNLIVNKKLLPDNKGHGYHFSMFVIGIFGAVAGILGLPFLTAATVRSVTHVNACQVWGTSHAPGEKPKLEEVKEQRVTGFFVHLCIGVSVLMGPILRKIPLPVLFGVFLYMGVASMSGVQLFDRVELMFKPVKYHPDIGYVKKVRTWRMHLYTFIQIICLGVLWVVKSTQAALGFPFILILLVPLRRFFLTRIYTEQELNELDADDMKPTDGALEYDSDEDDDIYREAHMPN